jgi:rhodanese-related sulfurtransferase
LAALLSSSSGSSSGSGGGQVVVLDLRTAAERNDITAIPTSVSFPVRKRIEDVIEAQAKARQAAMSATKGGKGKGKGKGKSGASKQTADAANAVSTALDAASVPRADHFAPIASFTVDKFRDRFGFAKPLPSDKLVFVSTGTTRAAELAEAAEQGGFKSVAVLDGGMRAWLKHWSVTGTGAVCNVAPLDEPSNSTDSTTAQPQQQ